MARKEGCTNTWINHFYPYIRDYGDPNNAVLTSDECWSIPNDVKCAASPTCLSKLACAPCRCLHHLPANVWEDFLQRVAQPGVRLFPWPPTLLKGALVCGWPCGPSCMPAVML